MLSDEQVRAIALLPKDQDFRFTTEYGKTVVVVPKPRGKMFIEEDGRLFYVSDSGARIADRKYEQREYEKLLAFKAEEKAKKEQADKEEAEHRATMRRIADSLDTIAALLARQK